jgi:DNA mismatch repair protein MutL
VSVATRIRVLSDSLVNKIAAGEVIERPASVVKELVENALDAGAGRVEVEVDSGGRALIRVRDDGHGMSRDDALLSLERHATSKISSDADLFALRSLGFRGEALPSIAEVSRFELVTGVQGQDLGSRVVVDGGVVKQVEDAPNAGGTEVVVRRLFFNVPVRLKFLRQPRTEMSHVVDVVTRIAMAHPHVGFSLRTADRTLVDAPPGDGLSDRVRCLLGKRTAQGLHSFHDEGGGLRAEGMISDPSVHRSNNSGLYLYVNGRPVRDRTFVGAVLSAYRGVVPRGRYPTVVFFLDLPPDRVDVNVHPTKAEVRFIDGRAIWQFVSSVLSEALTEVSAGAVARPQALARDVSPMQSSHEQGLPLRPPASRPMDSYPQVGTLASRAMDYAAPVSGQGEQQGFTGPPLDSSYALSIPSGQSSSVRGCSGRVLSSRALEGVEQRSSQVAGPAPSFSSLQFIGQFDRTFLLCESGGELVVVDQHAGHERVLFEQFRTRSSQEPVATQRLLVPELMEMDRARVLALCDAQDVLAEMGVELNQFGEDTVALHGVPSSVGAGRVRQAIADMADELVAGDVATAAERLRYDLSALLACHCAVRAHDPLSRDEVRLLFLQLDELDYNFACPHGRPVMVRFARSEVARWFVRD